MKLVIVLVLRIQEQQFCQMEKGHFGPTDQNDQTGQSEPTLKGGPKYSGRTQPKGSLPFDF